MSEAAARETVICWGEADGGVATVYTSQRRMVTRLRKIRGAKPVQVHRTEAGQWTGETWHVPVLSVLPRNVSRGGRPPAMTEERKAQEGDRLRAMRPQAVVTAQKLQE